MAALNKAPDYRELRPDMKEPELVEYAEEMKGKGESALIVEKENLGVKSLDFLENFDHLTQLQISGVVRGIQTVRSLAKLSHLELISVKVADYSFLADLDQLTSFSVVRGSCQDYQALRRTKIEDLTFWGVSSFSNVDFLADMTSLTSLEVTDCPRIGEFPSLAGLKKLTFVQIGGMRSLTSLQGIVEAPGLQRLAIGPVPSLPVEALAALAQVPALERIHLGIAAEGSKRWKEAVAQLPKHVEIA